MNPVFKQLVEQLRHSDQDKASRAAVQIALYFEGIYSHIDSDARAGFPNESLFYGKFSEPEQEELIRSVGEILFDPLTHDSLKKTIIWAISLGKTAVTAEILVKFLTTYKTSLEMGSSASWQLLSVIRDFVYYNFNLILESANRYNLLHFLSSTNFPEDEQTGDMEILRKEILARIHKFSE